MNNLLCISKDQLIQIFWEQSANKKLSKLLKKFFGKYSLIEIYQQMKDKKGEVAEYLKKEVEGFSKKTVHQEIADAITLADFYFLNSKPVICFEMKRGFVKKEVRNMNEIFENLETDTEIDCLIKDDKKEYKFQLKQYPEKYKNWSSSEVIEYLEGSILPKSKYNNESNSDLIIIITIKPEQQSGFKEEQDFNEIYKYLSSKSIKLCEIDFLYNRNMEYMVWSQVYPRNGYYKIPWQNLSYHQVKRKIFLANKT